MPKNDMKLGENPFTDKELQKFPLSFRFVKTTLLSPPEKGEWDEAPKRLAIDFCQTTQYRSHPHYRPISRPLPKPKADAPAK